VTTTEAVADRILRPTFNSGNAPPALLFGTGLTLLGVMRVLGRAGIPFYVVGKHDGFYTHSRWYRCLPGTASALPNNLASVLERLSVSSAVLMPCSDDWALAVANLPSSLRNRFPVTTPAPETVQTMVDKWRFAQFLAWRSIPHPETELLESRQAAENLPARNWHGKLLKPISSVEFTRKHNLKGFLVNSREEGLARARQIDFPVLLQEYIPGPPTASFFLDGFVDHEGHRLACFARQRLRMCPEKLGNSTALLSVPLAKVHGAVEIIERIIASLAYKGIFSAEFKCDERDHTYKIIELNARPWWYVEFAARCGVDVCSLAYRDALGLSSAAVDRYQVGRRCVFLPVDFHAYRTLRPTQKLSLWSWARSWLGAQDALFELSDPRPFFAFVSNLVRRRKRANKHCVPALSSAHGTRA